MEPFLFIALVVVLIIGIGVLSYLANQKRRKAFEELARRLGLTYRPDRDTCLVHRYAFLDKLREGSNRYASHRLSGTYEGEPVEAFDFHYETYSRDSNGRRKTQHHHYAFFILTLPATVPELEIGPEHFFSKLASAFGFTDINFESHEFSRTFRVKSKDKKFAYDFCNARMIDYLLNNRDLVIEVENQALSLCFNRRLAPEQVESRLKRLIQIRRLMPNYLFEGPL